MKRIDSLEKIHCTGCSACKAGCPVEAISMKEDENGFLYPYIDGNRCISCRYCVTICPECNVSIGDLPGKEPTEFFAMKHKDKAIHQTSQSGGAFYALAQKVIEQGGVVFGAAFQEDFTVAHTLVDRKSALHQLQGSKYVQSDMKDVIMQIKKLLENNREVLFCGTPCQCAGVASACKVNSERLLLVDLICHGVPSPKLWSDYLKEISRRYQGKVTNAVFRIMDGSRKGHIERITVKGKEYESVTYGQLFYSHAFFRASCDNCSYRSYLRVGDLTLGDWIYGQRTASDFWERAGVSQVLVNTKKGEKWLDEIKKLFYILPLNCDECIQPPLEGDYQSHPKKQEIQKLYREKGFYIIAKKYGHEDRTLRLKRNLKRIVKLTKQFVPFYKLLHEKSGDIDD